MNDSTFVLLGLVFLLGLSCSGLSLNARGSYATSYCEWW